MQASRRFRPLIAGIIATFVLAIVACWKYINGPPYVMHIQPSGEGSAVKIVQPRSYWREKLVSPVFQVPVSVPEPYEITLKSRNVPIPQGAIEFYDTTIKPGRFVVRFGNVKFDIMESRIIVDGVDHDWTPDDDGT